jgi:hypothetical protein
MKTERKNQKKERKKRNNRRWPKPETEAHVTHSPQREKKRHTTKWKHISLRPCFGWPGTAIMHLSEKARSVITH